MSTELLEAYAYCPICGAKELSKNPEGLTCGHCGHRVFNNPITAVAVFILDPRDRVLLIRRAKDPAQGKWAPPGGFVNAGETLEQAASREIAEETGIELRDLQYIGAFPNNYIYHGLSRPVCDVFFTARTDSFAVHLQNDEASDSELRPLAEIDPADLAFDSMRHALTLLRSRY